MLILNKYFYKNKKSKLCIGDRVAVLNDMFYEYGGSNVFLTRTCYTRHPYPLGPPGHRPAPRTVLQVKKNDSIIVFFHPTPSAPTPSAAGHCFLSSSSTRPQFTGIAPVVLLPDSSSPTPRTAHDFLKIHGFLCHVPRLRAR
jgi:hypothetical protein